MIVSLPNPIDSTVETSTMYSNSRNGATPFFAIITQRDHKYATPPPWKQFYVFLATAPTGVVQLQELLYILTDNKLLADIQ